MASATIVCALQYETHALRCALRDLPYTIHCCGPGARAIQTWAASAGEGVAHNHPVILAGLAGGLHKEFAVRSAHVISEVRDASGRTVARAPCILTESAESEPAIITSAGAIIVDRHDRAALATSSGADLVDLESVAFASIAQARGWRWGIVRGVSDDPLTALPTEVAHWVAPDGRTRPWAVARSLLRKPMLMRDVFVLQRNSRIALTAGAARLRSLLNAKDQRNR